MIIESYQLFYRYLENLILAVIIQQIRAKYNFKDDFDFYNWLHDFESWSKQYKEYEDLSVVREMKAKFTNLVTASAALTDLVSDFLKRRDDFSRHLDPFQDGLLRYISKTGLTHEELPTILMDFQNSWQNTLDSLPNIGKGRPSETHNKRCVNLLVMMYMHGSELEPICYRNDHREGQYCGLFYNFMIDMLPVLQVYGVTLDIEVESLGRYAAELIPQRGKDRPYNHTITQIDEFLLQE